MNRKRCLLVCIISLNLLNISQAYNSMLLTNFNVQATLAASCTISATNMNFGQYQANVPSQVIKATSIINILCNNKVPYYINTYKSGDSFTLYGNNEKNVLFYDLYTITWDNQTTSQSSYVGTGNGLSQSITMYGTMTYGYQDNNKNITPIPDNYSGNVITILDF